MSLFQKTKGNKVSLFLALFSLFFFIGSAYFVSPIFAFVPPGTLDPGCPPTQPDCTVSFYSDTNARAAISVQNIDGITYSSSTGIFTLTPGYIIPTSTSTDTWNNLLSASSTWNAAASWGNHATFGYLTASTAATTYLSLSASSSFLSTSTAAQTYLTQDNASSTYLSKDSASSTYLTQTNANSIYLSQVNANLNYLSTSSAAATYLNLSATSSFARLSGAIFTGSIYATNFSGSATGTNTGDESSSTIRTKLGVATAYNDGYLSASDWNIFNSKISSPWLTITNYSSLSSVPATGGTAFSDSNWPSNVPSQAFDGVLDGYNIGWINLGGNTGILGYQFAFGKILTRYTIYPWHGAQNESGRRPKNWTFEGSNNGINYTVLDTQVNQTSWTTSVGNIYTFSNSNSYIYYRLNISDNTGDANTAIAEIQFSGSGSPDTYSAAAGNVGVGTTNPLAKLDVNGNVKLGDGTDAVIKFNSTVGAAGAGGNSSTLVLQPSASNSTGQINLRPSGTSTVLPAFVLNDSSTGAIGSHSFLMGVGASSFNNYTTAYFASTISGNANADSYPIGFVVSNASAGRFTAMTVANSGKVGIGTSTPVSTLSVIGSGYFSGDLFIGTTTSSSTVGTVSNLYVNGTGMSSGGWTNGSSRSIKENFTQLDRSDILNKISQLELTQWNYIGQSTSTVHIGPIAEDFYSKFGLGGSDKSVSTIDPAGVALVGIQALSSGLSNLFGTTTLSSLIATSTINPDNFAITDVFAELVQKAIDKIFEVGKTLAGLVTNKLTVGSSTQPAGITLYDEDTKAPYCLKMKSGIMTSVPGDCANQPTVQNINPIAPVIETPINSAASTSETVSTTGPATETSTSTNDVVSPTGTISTPIVETHVVVDPTPAEPVVVPDPVVTPVVIEPVSVPEITVPDNTSGSEPVLAPTE